MSHHNKIDLYTQVHNALQSKLRIGQSKYLDKKNGTANQGIYSWNTYHTYLKQCKYFIRFVKAQNPKARTLQDCRQYIVPFLRESIQCGLSAYTCKLQASALAKLYGCSSSDFEISLPVRKRSEIKRSRKSAVRDRNFNEEKHRDLVEFCISTGLRRAELSQLRGNDLIEKDGRYWLHVHRATKGGRERYAPILPSTQNELEKIIQRMKTAGSDKVFSKIPGSADIHHYRRLYAQRAYDFACKNRENFTYEKVIIQNKKVVCIFDTRDQKQCNQIYRKYFFRDRDGKLTLRRDTQIYSNRYTMRCDQAKKNLVRSAILFTSQVLGHSRQCVVTQHYLTSFSL